MHNVKSGAASKSYGLQVAKLAGVPLATLKEARERLSALESGSPQTTNGSGSNHTKGSVRAFVRVKKTAWQLMSEDSDLIHSLVSRLATLAVGAGVRIATAESCTGGMIAARITDLAGSSVWYDRSFITYSNESKTEMLGVPAETIAAHGAVSEETVLAMALGALTASGANLTVAVSGVAGPDGSAALSIHR